MANSRLRDEDAIVVASWPTGAGCPSAKLDDVRRHDMFGGRGPLFALLALRSGAATLLPHAAPRSTLQALPALHARAHVRTRSANARASATDTSVDKVCMPAPTDPLPYAALAQLLARLEAESSRLRITAELATFFQDVLHRSARGLQSARDFWVCLQLCTAQVGPNFSGEELGLGDVGIAQAISLATGLSTAEVDAEYSRLGDLGLVAQAAAAAPTSKGRAPAQPPDVHAVHATLREIAIMEGDGSVERKAELAASLLRDFSPLERLYFVRTLRGSLRVGASEATVLCAIGRAWLASHGGLRVDELPAADARQAERAMQDAYARVPDFNLLVPTLISCPDLESLAERTQPGLHLPVRPMLPTPVKGVAEVLKRLKGGPMACEYKYDGERVQLHIARAEGEARVFSRSCEDVSEKYPQLCERAIQWLASGTDELIIEAEAVAYDREGGRILPFNLIARRPRKKARKADKPGAGPASDAPAVASVCLYAFDCLSRNGDSCLELGLRARREQLRASLSPIDGELAFASSLDVPEGVDADDATVLVDAFMDNALRAGCEGLVVKSLADGAVYEAGRRTLHALKLKRDYLDGAVDTVDLVPVGAYHGRGRRAGLFGAFLMACAKDGLGDAPTRAAGEGDLAVICKLGSGFTDENLATLTARLQEADAIASAPAPGLDLGSMPAARQPDVWLRPVAVWEVLAAEISPSPTYPAARGAGGGPKKGLALRFPRFVRVRDDKAPRDATPSSLIAHMYAQQQLDDR